MDTALNKGDFYTNDRNRLVTIYDNEELLQRALIRLCVKRGSFLYDKNLGSRLYTLTHNTKDIKAKVIAYAKEALLDMNDIIVDDVEVSFSNDLPNMNLNFTLTIHNEKFERAVTV